MSVNMKRRLSRNQKKRTNNNNDNDKEKKKRNRIKGRGRDGKKKYTLLNIILNIAWEED